MLARHGGILFETHDGLKTRVAPVARNLRGGTNGQMSCRDNSSYL
jgi:hypothetical protein